MDKKILIAIAVVIIAIIAVGFVALNQGSVSTPSGGDEQGSIKILAADSLAKQLNTTKTEFNKKYPNVDVQMEFSGSQAAIRKVTDLNKSADIVVSADYGLIDERLIEGGYASWNLKYANNKMVIAYTDKSKDADKINEDNWYQIFAQDDVKFGFSDPNSDPCGYRSVMVLQLAEIYYKNDTIFNDLIESNTAIRSVQNGDKYLINSPSSLNPNSKVTIREDAALLMPSLMSNDIDYVITYKNIAQQQEKDGVKFMELPDMLSLSSDKDEEQLSKIQLKEYSDTDKGKTITLSPIVYGITILDQSKDNKMALEFVKLLLSNEGKKIIEDSFQEAISPAQPTKISKDIPSELQ